MVYQLARNESPVSLVTPLRAYVHVWTATNELCWSLATVAIRSPLEYSKYIIPGLWAEFNGASGVRDLDVVLIIKTLQFSPLSLGSVPLHLATCH